MSECYRCGSDEHFARDCPTDAGWAPPPATRSASYEEHLARIDRFVAQWQAGAMTVEAKRRAIADENLAWYGRPVTRNGISLTTA